MRDYSKVSPQFWIGKTGKELKKKGTEAVIVALHLLTSSHANMLGMYYVPLVYIAHETGLGLEGAAKGLQWCLDVGFCDYDHDAEVVWVFEMATYQIAPSLKQNDNRCLGVQKEYNDQPESKHLRGFYEKYFSAFHMTLCREFAAPTKPLASQEQEQEQEQEQVNSIVELKPDAPKASLDVERIFNYWKQLMNSPKSVLDDSRKRVIARALKNYSASDICRAISGCSKSPYNMGKNDVNTKYNSIDLILRNADKIDHFIRLDSGGARSGSASLEEQNDLAMRELLGGSHDDERTIDMEVRRDR